MKNSRLEAWLIIFLAEILLIGISVLVSCNGISFSENKPGFISPEELTDFHQEDPNLVADSLLREYLADTAGADTLLKRTPLSKIGPKKRNIYLINPETNGKTPLDLFFESLFREKDTAVVRIAHYGDSQLEGDRMSWVMREKFHEKFGGSGVGYVPMKDLSPVSYVRNSSGNWAKYTVFHNRYSNSYYGLSGLVWHFSRHAVYQPEEGDSSGHSAVKDTQNIDFSNVYNGAYVSVKLEPHLKYKKVSILYGRSQDHTLVHYINNETGKRMLTDTLPPSDKVQMHKRVLDEPVLKLRIEFNAANSPDFYGIYLDEINGVQVDNYAIRGHSGDGLVLINDDHLKRMLELTNTRLIIFQYGANVVPCVHSEKACLAIEDMYYKIFMKFRNLDPDLSILVVSSGDMARGSTGGYSSYPWLPRIVEAQKNAALKANCAFFDLFHMMGGSNSILTWASRKLAVTNGHFSASGQEVVANELVDALMVEYNHYLHKRRKHQVNE